MIFRSLLTALVLIAGYTIFLQARPKIKPEGQHQWQDNIIKAQGYVYSDISSSTQVIVGSSLSCRMVMDLLPATVYNLALGAQSALDGLTIIARRDQKPGKVFVEMNVIDVSVNELFVDGLFNPVLFSARKNIEALQEKNQPLTVIRNYTSGFTETKIINPFIHKIFNPIVRKFSPINKDKTSKITVQTLLTGQLKAYEDPVDTQSFRTQFEILKKQVTKLREQGVQLIFFELPMYPGLQNSVRMRTIRQLFTSYFSPSEYHYLPIPDYSAYSTTDGFHMAGEHAAKFTNWFRENALMHD